MNGVCSQAGISFLVQEILLSNGKDIENEEEFIKYYYNRLDEVSHDKTHCLHRYKDNVLCIALID